MLAVSWGFVYHPHPLCPPLHDMDIYSYHEGEETLERGEAPLLPTLPLPLLREGGQGDRLLNDLADKRNIVRS